jgi:putative peptidoglycan lipid II flippase
VAATNVVAAVVLVAATDAEHTSPALVLAYTASYVVASFTSYLVLRHRLGGLGTRRLATFVGRLVVATAVATGLTFPVAQVLGGWSEDPGWVGAAARAAAVSAFDVVVFLVMARLLRIDEVTTVVRTVTRRLHGRSSLR